MVDFENKLLSYLKTLIQYSIVPHKQIEEAVKKLLPFANVEQGRKGNFLYIDMEESYVFQLVWEERGSDTYWLKEIKIAE